MNGNGKTLAEQKADEVLAKMNAGGGGVKEPSGPTALDRLIGDWFADINTGFVGVLSKNVDRRTGRTTYNLSDMKGNSVPMPTRMMSTTTRTLYSTAGGIASPLGKLSESDIRRAFGVDT